MENKTKAMQQFEQFAEEILSNHLVELNTRYENEKIDKQTMQQAYRKHQEIYSRELDEKVQSLLSAERNNWLFTFKNEGFLF